MNMNSVCLCVLVLLFESGHSNSLCDDIFVFVTDGKNEFGRITLQPVEVVSKLQIRINFTVQSRLGNYIGRLDLPDDVLRKYNRGETVYYRVYFPVILPRPKVTSISLNGATICSGAGDQPRRNQAVTRRSLGEQGGPPPYKEFYHELQMMPQPIVHSTPQYVSTKFGVRVRRTAFNPDPNSQDEKYVKAFVMKYFGNLYSQDSSSPVTQQTATARPTATRPNYVEPVTYRPYGPPDTTTDCGIVAGGNGISPLIHNGLSYERGEIPWLVAIYAITKKSPKFRCGGTLVSDRHVVTAAHCMYRSRFTTATKDIIVRVGVHELDEWTDDDIAVIRKPIAADIPESYNLETLKDDIMVLTLNKRVKFNNFIRPACLWIGNTELHRIVGANGVVAGWGGTNERNSVPLDEPQKVYVPIVSTTECKASKPIFHTLTSNNTLCAGTRNGDGPCLGDSGGGLYLLDDSKWKLRGVLSVLARDDNPSIPCNLNEYVVYTDTAKFLPWIQSIISKNNFD